MSYLLSDPALEVAERWQRGFPICTHPFAEIGKALDLTSSEIISMLVGLKARGALGRVGAAVRPNTIGSSTLAAMAVPAERIEEVAHAVTAEDAVNHNYERDHEINLWFVVTAPERHDVLNTLRRISDRTGLQVLDLPLEQSYHIDLGFRLNGPRRGYQSAGSSSVGACEIRVGDRELLSALEPGLSLVQRPYHDLASRLGWSEGQVMASLERLVDGGVISRFGCILRHRKIGFSANAMAVWDVPDDKVDEIATRLAKIDNVTLCYRRCRRFPHWPYNLFAMIHGTKRQLVRSQIGAAELACGLYAYPSAVLFSTRCFKQSGARYFAPLRGAA